VVITLSLLLSFIITMCYEMHFLSLSVSYNFLITHVCWLEYFEWFFTTSYWIVLHPFLVSDDHLSLYFSQSFHFILVIPSSTLILYTKWCFIFYSSQKSSFEEVFLLLGLLDPPSSPSFHGQEFLSHQQTPHPYIHPYIH